MLRLHADAGNILSGMTADAQMIVKDLHDLARSAYIHLLLYQSARHGIVVIVILHQVVAAHSYLEAPIGMLVGVDRKRLERGLFHLDE